jgi:hypothetical protein
MSRVTLYVIERKWVRGEMGRVGLSGRRRGVAVGACDIQDGDGLACPFGE